MIAQGLRIYADRDVWNFFQIELTFQFLKFWLDF